MKTIIIPLSDDKLWNEVLSNATSYDFYHTNSYHLLDGTEDAFLFHVSNDSNFIAIPLLKRAIEGTAFFDCTSVYGYAGPITNLETDQDGDELVAYFQRELTKYFKDQKIISAFSRLHPLIEQDDLLGNIGEIVKLNKTVSIDLTLPIDKQRQQFRKSIKSEISQLHRKGYRIKIAETVEEIDCFVEIYKETMDRVDASNSYYFDRNYFHDFLNSKDFTSKLHLAYKEDEIAAGAIFTSTKNIIQYHLAGTRAEFMKEAPMKLIIDEVRLLGSSQNMSFFHLGGGVGGQDDDPLFRFKSGFSNLNFNFSVWNYVVDPEVYGMLVEERSKDRSLNQSYFPLYRG